MAFTLPIVCLMGPTASGKTDLALALVQRFPMQIINADSALIYQGLNIGAAKPGPDILARAPHRLLDICDPAQVYSAGDFRRDALREIDDIHRQGQIPLLVGGTMLYFWTLQRGLADLPSASPSLRQQIASQAADLGWPELHTQLQQIDPAAAQRIHPNDGQRIQRALEVYYLTGKPISTWQTQSSPELPLPVINVVLAPKERTFLHQRIAQRLENMFSQGLIAEVTGLRARGDLHADLPALRTVGYRQVWQYLAGAEIDLAHLKEQIYQATCQLAKRQLTWLQRWSQAHWLAAEAEQTELLCEMDKIMSIIPS